MRIAGPATALAATLALAASLVLAPPGGRAATTTDATATGTATHHHRHRQQPTPSPAAQPTAPSVAPLVVQNAQLTAHDGMQFVHLDVIFQNDLGTGNTYQVGLTRGGSFVAVGPMQTTRSGIAFTGGVDIPLSFYTQPGTVFTTATPIFLRVVDGQGVVKAASGPIFNAAPVG